MSSLRGSPPTDRRSFNDKREAIKYAQQVVGSPLDEFQALARSWRQYDEWTVVLAPGRYSPTGMSIVLPLRREAYQAVRAGELGFVDLGPTHLLRPSRYLLVVGLAERPVDMGGDDGNTTTNLLHAITSQVSILSYCHGQEQCEPLHFLAPAGTPRNKERLQAMKYQPLGTVLRWSRHPLYERIYRWPFSPDDFFVVGASNLLGRYAERVSLAAQAEVPCSTRFGIRARCRSSIGGACGGQPTLGVARMSRPSLHTDARFLRSHDSLPWPG